MKCVDIDKGGFRYKWVVRGMDESACVADIQENKRTSLSDYTAIRFAEQYGCVADVEQFRLMTHNEFQQYMQKNATRLSEDKNYTSEDYKRDAKRVEVMSFNLEKFGLSRRVQEAINTRFSSISFDEAGAACLQCHVGSTMAVGLIAKELGCELVCNQGFNGFYKSDKNKFILEFCDGDVSLLICPSQREYANRLADFNHFYEIDGYDVCIEVFFDNVHMDNVILPRENVSMAISSIMQRGYAGYDSTLKDCWEVLLRKNTSPNISFHIVEAPTMVRDLEFSFVGREQYGFEDVLASATQRAGMNDGFHVGRSFERDFV